MKIVTFGGLYGAEGLKSGILVTLGDLNVKLG